MPPGKDSLSIRERAYAYIQGKIAAREIPAGSAVYDVVLTDELGSSRTPVREALQKLLSEGYLIQTANGSIEVARFTGHEVSELFEMREALELHAIRRVAISGLPEPDQARGQHILGEMIAIENQLVKSKKADLELDQMRRYEIFDIAFHTVLIRAADNLRILKKVNEIRSLIGTFTMRHKGHNAAEVTRLNQQHQHLLDLILDHQADEATSILSEHIQYSKKIRLVEYGLWERESSLRESVPELTRLSESIAVGDDLARAKRIP